ncbi:MAG TPA: Rrf2 family transcriptional regulator [Bacteroidia bacterium]|jgi:Rrf2 family protein|nr:Rrf2 family transcriptional regulator [Bacteroidia bacterium]
MLSKKTKYAIKALLALSHTYEKGPVLISWLAEEEKLPRKFLETILLELKNQGILGSKKGAGGGYYLIKPPSEVMLSSVIRMTDGPISLIPCVSLNFYERCDECVDEATCGLRDVARQVRDASLNILSNTSLQHMIDREKALKRASLKKKARTAAKKK